MRQVSACLQRAAPHGIPGKIKALVALREEMVLRAKAEGGDAEAARCYMSDIEWHFIGHLQTNKLKNGPAICLTGSVR